VYFIFFKYYKGLFDSKYKFCLKKTKNKTFNQIDHWMIGSKIMGLF